MKKLHRFLFLGFALSLGACATTGQAVARPSAEAFASAETATQHGEHSRREYAAATASLGRDDAAGMARSERGIPTPQPARDPDGANSGVGPIPLPPLPARGGGGVASHDTGW